MTLANLALAGFIVFGIITLVMTKKRKKTLKRIFMALTLMCWLITLGYMLASAA